MNGAPAVRAFTSGEFPILATPLRLSEFVATLALAQDNAFGQPLMRMTFDYKENEHRMGRHAAQLINNLASSMNPTKLNPAVARTQPWTAVPYQSTHNTGGTVMGSNPREAAVNKYLQSWDCHNLFVIGANVFPHNASYNPTGPVGALAYWTADAIKNRYLKNPGPLVLA